MLPGRLSDVVEEGNYSERVRASSHAAIAHEIDDINDVPSNYASESELGDHASVLRRPAPRAGVPKYALQRALETVDERVQVAQAKASDPAIPNTNAVADEAFGDEALYCLFDSLR